VDKPVMMHDFAITEHFAVFIEASLTFKPEDLVSGPAHKSRLTLMNDHHEYDDWGINNLQPGSW
jgi:carotenoid cleavage dioxygenase-like enzyme